MCAFHSIPPVHYVFDSTSIAVTCGKQVAAIIWNQMVYPIRHYFPDIRANHRPGCWKQLPLPVPHCWQYRRRLESIATVCIIIADPSLEVCVPRHLSRLWGRSTAVTAVSSRQSWDAPAEALLGLRQGQLYVAGDSDILLSRFSRGEGLFCPSIYIIAIKSQIVQKNQKNFYNFYYKPPKAIKFCYNKAKYSIKTVQGTA